MPYSFQRAGYLLSTFVFLIIAIVTYQTWRMLFKIQESYRKENITYSQIAQFSFGRKGQLLVQTFLIIFQIGCCVSYIIFFTKFFEHAFSTENSKATDLLYISIALCVILPMTLINDITLFAKVRLSPSIPGVLLPSPYSPNLSYHPLLASLYF